LLTNVGNPSSLQVKREQALRDLLVRKRLTTGGALGRICPHKPASPYGNTSVGHYQSEMEK
jgi:hypothetical protein